MVKIIAIFETKTGLEIAQVDSVVVLRGAAAREKAAEKVTNVTAGAENATTDHINEDIVSVVTNGAEKLQQLLSMKKML